MRSFPNMTVVQPADAVAARALAHAAVDFTGPLYVRLHRNPVADLYDPATYKFEWGKANTVVDNGSDMTMIVSGILLKKALDAAAILKEQGIGVRVLDMATIKPLDKEAVLKAAGETGAIMTIEDHSIFGGLGSAVAEVVVGNCPVPMEIVGIQDRFGESGDPELIYKDHGMDVDSIVAKAKALVARKGLKGDRHFGQGAVPARSAEKCEKGMNPTMAAPHVCILQTSFAKREEPSPS